MSPFSPPSVTSGVSFRLSSFYGHSLDQSSAAGRCSSWSVGSSALGRTGLKAAPASPRTGGAGGRARAADRGNRPRTFVMCSSTPFSLLGLTGPAPPARATGSAATGRGPSGPEPAGWRMPGRAEKNSKTTFHPDRPFDPDLPFHPDRPFDPDRPSKQRFTDRPSVPFSCSVSEPGRLRDRREAG